MGVLINTAGKLWRTEPITALMKNTGINLVLVLSMGVMALAVMTYLAPHFGWQINSVVSGSMEPAISRGEMVVVRPVDPGEVRVGDIVIINRLPDKDLNVCHRVVAIRYQAGLHFVTKGDANPLPDPLDITGRNIAGRVVFHIPALGYLIRFIYTPVGFALTLFIPGLLVLLLYLDSLRSLIRRRRSGTGVAPDDDPE
jgi:signal peptidase